MRDMNAVTRARLDLLAKFPTPRGTDPIEACRTRAALRLYRKKRDGIRKAFRRKGVKYNIWKAAQRRKIDGNA